MMRADQWTRWRLRAIVPLHLLLLVATNPVAVAQAQRPQDPLPPYPYDAREIAFDNPRAGIQLAGTLTLPRSEGPFPAVMLISGSGPQDRNGSLAGHRPFLVLADFLTRRGIAVLRCDDRGGFGSTGDFDTATTQDFAGDVLAGIEFLKTCGDIEPRQIGLIGHSEGGLIAPMVATRSPDVAFIVMMAGPGLVGEEILYAQQALIARTLGASEEDIAAVRAFNEPMYAALKAGEDSADAEERVRAVWADAFASLSEEDRQRVVSAFEEQLPFLLSPWFRFFLTYDPAPALQQVGIPILAINGEKDLQVPPRENLDAIGAVLRASGHPDYSLVEIPGLNHLFQTAGTGSPTEYAQIEETISPVVLELIADWIVSRTLASPSTAVREDHPGLLPQAFTLAQNYPNPFNSATVIRFALSQDGAVALAVYNAAGQKVAVLVQGLREAGEYAITWDGRDEHGNPLASGVYLYRLEAGESQVRARHLVLLR